MSRTEKLQLGSKINQANIQFALAFKRQAKLTARTSLLVLLVVVAIVGCSDVGKPGPVATTSAKDAASASNPVESAPPLPSGSTTVTCSSSRPVKPGTDSLTDLVIGPLVYPEFDHANNLTMRPPVQNGVRFFKIGTHLVNGSAVTVSVAPEAREYAGIKTEDGPWSGFSTVTYESCSSKQNESVWWVGGFILIGRESACLPLDIQIKGEATPRRVVIPLGTSNCQ